MIFHFSAIRLGVEQAAKVASKVAATLYQQLRIFLITFSQRSFSLLTRSKWRAWAFKAALSREHRRLRSHPNPPPRLALMKTSAWGFSMHRQLIIAKGGETVQLVTTAMILRVRIPD